MKKIKFLSFMLLIFQMLYFLPFSVFAEELSDNHDSIIPVSSPINNMVDSGSISRYLLIDSLHDDDYISCLLSYQNPDGGFGLAENYTSDIIDTKLALKALADLGETEAMTKAAIYIASLQNADGGFSYQQGLASDPELTAEIADIFGDCIIKDQSLAYTLSDTLINI